MLCIILREAFVVCSTDLTNFITALIFTFDTIIILNNCLFVKSFGRIVELFQSYVLWCAHCTFWKFLSNFVSTYNVMIIIAAKHEACHL